ESNLYMDMTFLPEYSMFSAEEHRLEDYKQTRTGSVPVSSLQQTSNIANAELSTGVGLASLRGKGIEVHVGSQSPSDENTWTLPIKLISQHSEYFKAACLWNMTGKISLPEQDPIAFGLFVERMYYETHESSTFEPSPSIHTKCWVLADYLLCNELKDHAMCGLFDDHVEKGMLFGSTAISCKDVQYVCRSTAPDSNLRQFYS
ncbi:hypothetical protein LB507_011507, partial [Fusarium sp. FIESC RH6]